MTPIHLYNYTIVETDNGCVVMRGDRKVADNLSKEQAIATVMYKTRLANDRVMEDAPTNAVGDGSVAMYEPLMSAQVVTRDPVPVNRLKKRKKKRAK